MTSPTDDQAHIPQQQAGPAPTGFLVPPDTARRSRRWWWIAAAAVVVVLAVAGGTAYALAPSEQDHAVKQCQTAITAKLTAPSTAKYGDPTVTSQAGDFGTYYNIFGTVDAQNGFGAMVRGTYLCKVTREKNGRWTMTESTVTQN